MIQVRGSDRKGSWHKKKDDGCREGKNLRGKSGIRINDEDSSQNDREKNDDSENGGKEKRGMILCRYRHDNKKGGYASFFMFRGELSMSQYRMRLVRFFKFPDFFRGQFDRCCRDGLVQLMQF